MTSDHNKSTTNPHAYFLPEQELIYIEAQDLYVSTEKQHQIDKDDLRALSNKNTESGHARQLLARYELTGGRELEKLDAFLKKIGVKDHPLFNKMNLSALLDLHALLNSGTDYRTVDNVLTQEAAAVAIKQAETPGDFAARYLFYLCCAKKLRLEEFTPAIRGAHISQVQEAMESALTEYLRGPEICIPPPPQLVWDLLNEWFVKRENIGFADVGTGLLLTARHITLIHLSDTEIVRAVHEFVRHMQIFFRHHHATDAQLAQVDERWIYRFNYPEVRARLTLVPGGCLTLEHYHLVCSQLMETTYERDENSSSPLQL